MEKKKGLWPVPGKTENKLWYNLFMKRILPILLVIILGTVVFVFSMNQQAPTQNMEQKKTSLSSDTPKECSGKPIVVLAEGPYYKEGSPRRQKISGNGTSGTHLILKGYVLDTNCKPISNAWLDFWQADGNGNYDNEGYNLRGHQFTNKEGFFRIETVVPGEYPGRPPHIHFKVRASDSSPVITSQLFFPGENRDSIFDESLVVDFGTDPDGSKFASYNIIVNN